LQTAVIRLNQPQRAQAVSHRRSGYVECTSKSGDVAGAVVPLALHPGAWHKPRGGEVVGHLFGAVMGRQSPNGRVEQMDEPVIDYMLELVRQGEALA
jgi:hypothetical protein